MYQSSRKVSSLTLFFTTKKTVSIFLINLKLLFASFIFKSIIYIAGKIGDNRPAMKITTAKQSYEEHATTFFHQRLQVLNKPQKQIIMERHLQKFEDEKMRQDAIAKHGDREEREARER